MSEEKLKILLGAVANQTLAEYLQKVTLRSTTYETYHLCQFDIDEPAIGVPSCKSFNLQNNSTVVDTDIYGSCKFDFDFFERVEKDTLQVLFGFTKSKTLYGRLCEELFDFEATMKNKFHRGTNSYVYLDENTHELKHLTIGLLYYGMADYKFGYTIEFTYKKPKITTLTSELDFCDVISRGEVTVNFQLLKDKNGLFYVDNDINTSIQGREATLVDDTMLWDKTLKTIGVKNASLIKVPIFFMPEDTDCRIKSGFIDINNNREPKLLQLGLNMDPTIHGISSLYRCLGSFQEDLQDVQKNVNILCGVNDLPIDNLVIPVTNSRLEYLRELLVAENTDINLDAIEMVHHISVLRPVPKNVPSYLENGESYVKNEEVDYDNIDYVSYGALGTMFSHNKVLLVGLFESEVDFSRLHNLGIEKYVPIVQSLDFDERDIVIEGFSTKELVLDVDTLELVDYIRMTRLFAGSVPDAYRYYVSDFKYCHRNSYTYCCSHGYISRLIKYRYKNEHIDIYNYARLMPNREEELYLRKRYLPNSSGLTPLHILKDLRIASILCFDTDVYQEFATIRSYIHTSKYKPTEKLDLSKVKPKSLLVVCMEGICFEWNPYLYNDGNILVDTYDRGMLDVKSMTVNVLSMDDITNMLLTEKKELVDCVGLSFTTVVTATRKGKAIACQGSYVGELVEDLKASGCYIVEEEWQDMDYIRATSDIGRIWSTITEELLTPDNFDDIVFLD